jgi:hypothetical protein
VTQRLSIFFCETHDGRGVLTLCTDIDGTENRAVFVWCFLVGSKALVVLKVAVSGFGDIALKRSEYIYTKVPSMLGYIGRPQRFRNK